MTRLTNQQKIEFLYKNKLILNFDYNTPLNSLRFAINNGKIITWKCLNRTCNSIISNVSMNMPLYCKNSCNSKEYDNKRKKRVPKMPTPRTCVICGKPTPKTKYNFYSKYCKLSHRITASNRKKSQTLKDAMDVLRLRCG